MNSHKSSHHHKHKHQDDAEVFKRKQFNSTKRRKFLSKLLFAVLSVLSVLVIFAVAWLYFIAE